MTLSDLLSSDRRLVVLRILEQTGDTLNESVLQTVLEQFGHRVSRDVVRAELAWLTEQGLVTSETVGGRIIVVTLTERGADVARGRAKHPGVKRPSPGGPRA